MLLLLSSKKPTALQAIPRGPFQNAAVSFLQEGENVKNRLQNKSDIYLLMYSRGSYLFISNVQHFIVDLYLSLRPQKMQVLCFL